MSLFDKQRAYYNKISTYLSTQCPPNEPLRGAMLGTQARTFSNDFYAIGVTDNYLIVQKLTKKQEPVGPSLLLQPIDILNAALWGHGGGFREWWAAHSEFQIRFETRDYHYKLLVLGGKTMAKAMGQDFIDGIEAVANWLANARMQ